MRAYETIFIIAPTASDEERTKLIEEQKSFIEREKGKIEKIDVWGMKKLAFPVKKFTEGFYVYFLYQGYSGIVERWEKKLKLTESIIRYLTVKVDLTKLLKEEKEIQPAAEATP